jgi:hypothetical protein
VACYRALMKDELRTNAYYDWSHMTPPARPSPKIVDIYRQALTGDGHKVLLFGATPEIRSLCHEHGHDLLVADMSKDIYTAVSSLVEVPGAETFINENWMTMSPGDDFSFAMGDGVVNMLEHQLHRPFFEAASRALKPGGALVIHTHFVSKREFESPGDVFRWWREQEGRLYEQTWYHLTHFYDVGEPGQFTFDYELFYADLPRLHRAGDLTQAELDEYCKLLGRHLIKIYFCDWDTLRSNIEGLFQVESSVCADDYPGAEAHPVLTLRRAP